jgi:hypothetical protein
MPQYGSLDACWSDVGVTLRHPNPVHTQARPAGARHPASRGRGRCAREPRLSVHAAPRRNRRPSLNAEIARQAGYRRRPRQPLRGPT